MNSTNRAGRRATVGVLVAATMAAAGETPSLDADEIRVVIAGGRVTLSATEAPLADVLAEWSRVGGTRFVGADALGDTVTLRLVDAHEADALRLLLRSAAGYVAAPRRGGGDAHYDRVTILAAGTTTAQPVAEATAEQRPNAVPDSPPAGIEVPAGLVSMEELQGLLDAAAAANGGTPADPPVSTVRPVQTTPFPGVGIASAVPDSQDR